eukprot:1583821-Pyramimonas_sp.AAC.1
MHLSDVTAAICSSMQRYLHGALGALKVAFPPHTTLENEMVSILATFRFRGAAPYLPSDRWTLL